MAVWSELTPRQRKLQLAKYHEKRDAAKATHVDPLDREVAPGLTLRQLNQSTSAAAQLRYGAEGQQLAALPQRTNDWYSQYQNAIKAARTSQEQANRDAVAGVAQLQQGLDTASQQAWAGEQARMQADAANRGATLDPVSAEQAHNASNVRNALTGSFGALLINQGQADRKGYTDRLVSSGQQRVTEQARIGSARRQLAREKGAFKQTYRDQAISDASKRQLENALSVGQLANLDAKTRQAVADVFNTNADTTATNAKTAQTKATTAFLDKYGYLPSSKPSALEQAKLDYFEKNGYFPPTGPPNTNATGKDKFGNTRKDRERYQNNWERSKALAKLIGGKDVNDLTQLIIAKDSTTPPWMARAAAQQLILGYVGPNLRTRLKRHGVKKGYKAPAPTAAGGGTAVEGGGV